MKKDKEELSEEENTDEYWMKMINEVDKNGDGEIDYSEFIDMMNTINFKK